MSRGSDETGAAERAAARAAALKALAGELRQFNGLGASYFRAAAAQAGMTVTDMQVVDLLESGGPTTAGQLAEQTGLTTGAITGVLNRLEEAGLARRERDPEDGRRFIIQRAPGKGDQQRAIGSIFAALGGAWDELVARYDAEQLALLVDFLKQSNAATRAAMAQLREPAAGDEEVFTAPLEGIERGLLVVASAPRLTLRVGAQMTDLYQARFTGAAPTVKAAEGTVSMRYSRRLWKLGGDERAAEVTLNAAIPWKILIQGGVLEMTAELEGLDLVGLEVAGGASMLQLNLPTPTGVVPLRISGGASVIKVQRPAGAAARAHLKGWASTFEFDGQSFTNLGADVRLQSPGAEQADNRYDIEVASSASTVQITTN